MFKADDDDDDDCPCPEGPSTGTVLAIAFMTALLTASAEKAVEFCYERLTKKKRGKRGK